MFQKYQCRFEAWGMFLFLAIMVPNFIWFAVPAPHDVLREGSAAGVLGVIASVCQVWMVAALCAFKNRKYRKMGITPLTVLVIVCCLLYFACWIFYYTGVIHPLVLLGLMVPPCFAFLFFAIDRKNGLAVLPILIFTVCHLVDGMASFII